MAHKVTAALVSIKDPAGKNTYFYQGATVPDGFNEGDIERLAGEGMLEAPKAEAVEAEAPKPPVRSAK